MNVSVEKSALTKNKKLKDTVTWKSNYVVSQRHCYTIFVIIVPITNFYDYECVLKGRNTGACLLVVFYGNLVAIIQRRDTIQRINVINQAWF